MELEGGTGPGPAREVRVEGIGLVLLAGALLIVVSGVFYLGYQMGSARSPQGALAAAATEPVETTVPTVTPPAGVFDTVPEKGAAEPARQATQAPAPASAQVATPTRSVPTSGDWFVQVFAGRDRRAAESVLTTLTTQGYPAQLDSKREGRESLYKVRVGGYPEESGARAAADRLKKSGQSGAWVTRVR